MRRIIKIECSHNNRHKNQLVKRDVPDYTKYITFNSEHVVFGWSTKLISRPGSQTVSGLNKTPSFVSFAPWWFDRGHYVPSMEKRNVESPLYGTVLLHWYMIYRPAADRI